MNLRLMSIFCKVVETGVMAHAAGELDMTPAAVTKAIGELEHSLGLRLLNRTTRKMQLTAAGLQYYDACVAVLSQVSEMHSQFSSLASEVKGRLKIVAPMSYGVSNISDVLVAFTKEYPKVDLVVHLEDGPTDLIEEGYDLAIRIQRNMKDSSLIAKSFGEFEIVLVCSKAYMDKNGPIRKPADLKKHRCMSYSNAKHPNRWIFSNDDEQIEHGFTPYIETNSSMLLKNLAEKDKGICYLPSFLIKDELKSGKLVRVLPQYSIGTAKAWIVYPSRKFNPPAVLKFTEFFLNWNRQ